MSEKENRFYYFCHKLINRYDELWLEQTYQDPILKFGRLGVMKMLFFAVLSDNKNSQKNQMITIFNNWSALPNWPVEMDCYRYIKPDNALEYIGDDHVDFEDKLVQKKFEEYELKVDEYGKIIIDWAVNKIPVVLFRKSTYQLVERSHRYRSWIDAFKCATNDNKKVYPINPDIILKENILSALF